MNPVEAEYFCAACRTPFTTPYPLDENGLCGICRRGLRSFDGAFCHASYDGVTQKLIQLFKYGRVYPLAVPLGERLSVALPRNQRIDLIVPVPLHWTRRWSRGFNQSALLARELSRRCGVPWESVLRRTRRTPTQTGLSDRERRRNVARSFLARNDGKLNGKHVLLVDDVMTTGSTAAACAEALKRAGAARVLVLTLARADRRVISTLPTGKARAKTAGG